MNENTPRQNRIALVITASVIGIYMIYLIAVESFVLGSYFGGWVYTYFENPTIPPLWIPLAAYFMLSIYVLIGSVFIHSHEKLTLLVGYLNLSGVQVLLRKTYPYSLGEFVLSDKANSFYRPAIEHSALEILKNFQQLAPTFPLHARGNMPGKILLFDFLSIFTSSSELLGILLVATSMLGGVFLYLITKELFSNQAAGFYALILYALLPSKIFFLPLLNTVTPVFILFSLYLLLKHLRTKKRFYAVALGISLYILLLFEPSPLAMGLVFLGILLHALKEKKLLFKEAVHLVSYLLLAFLGTYLVFRLFFAFDIFSTFRYIVQDAVKYNAEVAHPYWIWVGENAKEFFVVTGAPVMVIFIYMTAQFLALPGEEKKFKNWSIETTYIISLIAVYTFVTFLGINRGEITRLWIYMAVFFQVPAALFLAQIKKGELSFFFMANILLLQSIIMLTKIMFSVP